MSLASSSLFFGTTVLLVATSGCMPSAPVTPFHIRAGAAATGVGPAPGQPLAIDFKAGDRIPVVIRVDGEVVATDPNPTTVWLTAKRDFSVRIRGSEIKTALDGVSFDAKPTKPGHFQFGFEVQRGEAPKVVIAVTTPEHAKP